MSALIIYLSDSVFVQVLFFCIAKLGDKCLGMVPTKKKSIIISVILTCRVFRFFQYLTIRPIDLIVQTIRLSANSTIYITLQYKIRTSGAPRKACKMLQKNIKICMAAVTI